MNVLSVKNLNKSYKDFSLKNVSFDLEEGKITGFIGRNGAGKTTTLKSILNLVHIDSGEIKIFDKDLIESELEIKKEIGFVSGGIKYYSNKKIKYITDVTKRFFKNWDEDLYKSYIKKFKLNEDKTPEKLSEGMKVKYSLALALSHHAKILILDEPTSGLDPVSRDELLEIFMDIVEKEKVTILFSTHITSDLEKCADNIIFIKDGEIKENSSMDELIDSYKIIKFNDKKIIENNLIKIISMKKSRNGKSALIKTKDLKYFNNIEYINADLESIIVYTSKED